MTDSGSLMQSYEAFRIGRLSRRGFLRRALALGVGMPLAQAIAYSTPAQADSSPPKRPAGGVAGQQRGAGGPLTIYQAFSISHLNGIKGTSQQESTAINLVNEPLMAHLPDGSLVPILIEAVPTIENGLLAPDLTSATFKLLGDVLWSDGTPLTAADVVATWQYLRNVRLFPFFPYLEVASVDALDSLTVRVVYNRPFLGWFMPFAGGGHPGIYPAHVLNQGPDAVAAFDLAPIGTGPYVVRSFRPGGEVVFAVNDRYRERTKPYFESVTFKNHFAGSPAPSLDRGTADVLIDVVWSPDDWGAIKNSGNGRLVVVPGHQLAQILFNFADPNKEVNGQRSQWQTPNPVMSDWAVRMALTLALDRKTLAGLFWPGEEPTGNFITGTPFYELTPSDLPFDPDQAKRLLNDAGWMLNGKYRFKDGRPLRILLTGLTTTEHEEILEFVRRAWAKIGARVKVEPRQQFEFYPAPSNELGWDRFAADAMLFWQRASFPSVFPHPLYTLRMWYDGGGQNIPQAENRWQGTDLARYSNPAFNNLFQALEAEFDLDRALGLVAAMNDHLIEDAAAIPLARITYTVVAVTKSIRQSNVAVSSFEPVTWNIANWNRTG